MDHLDLDKIGELLAELPPAPDAWVEAAALIPRTLRDLEGVAETLSADPERALETARLEAALRDAGIAPEPATIAALRARLSE
jgi:hypothetical protein